MKSHADVFSAQKLSFVVFDNIDMTVSRCAEDQLAMIFRKFCKQSDTQVVVTARTWHPILKNMRKRLLNPLLLIGNFLEAALYGKMNIQVQFNLEAAKLDFVYGKYLLNAMTHGFLINFDDYHLQNTSNLCPPTPNAC